LLAQVWTGYPTIFSFQNQFLKIKLNFQWQNLFKIQYLLDFKSKNSQNTFIKSYSIKAFQKYQDYTQIPLKFLVLI